MAAPPPYWKKKTRPCPFYSQGRCLFSDSCNFVHSVKVNHDPPAVRADNTLPGGIYRDEKTRVDGENDAAERTLVETEKNAMNSSPKSLSRSSSGSRRRSLLSPPRSPRLSGLLSALESVIGPDVEEYEEFDEEDGSESIEDSTEAPEEARADVLSPASTSSSSRDSTSLPYCQDSPAAPNAQTASSFDDSDPQSPTVILNVDTETNVGASAPTRLSSTRSRVPSPIITQHLDPGESITTVLDNDTPEVHPLQQTHYSQHLHQFDDPLTPSRGSRPHSTFELLTSPFASPALRILSPNVGEPISPIFGALQRSSTPNSRLYADDDVHSLETLESSTEESLQASSGSSISHDFEFVDYSVDDADAVNPSEHTAEGQEDLGSPHETERPTSDYFRTPRNPPSHDEAVVEEIEDLPPLPPSLTRNSDGTNRRLSQVAFLSSDSEHLSSSPPLATSSTYVLSEPSSSTSELSSPPKVQQSTLATDDDFEQASPLDDESSSVLDDLYGELSASPSRAEELAYESREADSKSAAIVPAVHISSIGRLNPIITTRNDRGSLDSLTNSSLGPSPVSTDRNSTHTSDTMDTLVESDIDEHESMHETILERRTKHANGSPKRLEVVSVTSPTKELRESYFPSSLEKTVKPGPSPLYEDSQHSVSSSVASSAALSPRPSWADLQKKAGVSQKVPFGFRQSLLVDQEVSTSLAEKLASHSIHGSSASRSSSGSSLSPTSAFHARPSSRVDILAGRARSISPASIVAGPSSHRHSFSSKSSSVPSLRVRSFANQPHSASQLEFFSNCSRSDSPTHIGGSEPSSSRSASASWMKPLRLSRVNSPESSDQQHSPALSYSKRFSTASILSSKSHSHNASQGSLVDNSLLSSSRSSLLSAYLDDSNIPAHDIPPIISNDGPYAIESVLFSSHLSNASLGGCEVGHRHSQSTGTANDVTSNIDLLSPLSGSMRGLDFEEFSRFHWASSNSDTNHGEVSLNEDISPKRAITSVSFSHILIPPPSAKSMPTSARIPIPAPSHAIATPRPTLMFAIASDNPAEVERVLASGEAHPNDIIGPQTALEFALTNDALVNKTEIVKTLLAYGADPNTLPEELRNVHDKQVDGGEEEEDILADLPSDAAGASISKRKKRESTLNPAMKYYLNRATAGAQAVQTSAALRRSDFRSLARMRFDFVGQDRALEHLYWVLGMHSQQPIGTPLVVLCCGPSGHGKSLLARKFGSLLDVPTHTVNMTILKTSHDLWQCPSMSPYDPPSERTLAEFLEENAGKRCVVVLDEIDKNEDERTLWSLLAPWELGRCSIDAGRRHIDVRNVIWLGTSNIGQDLVFEHHGQRAEPDSIISKAEYRELMNSLRPLVTERLGTSLMSRVTAVLPFVPFTDEEKLAIASEAVLALGGEMASELAPEEFEKLASQCVAEYVSTDGARSLYRSVSTHLMEAF